jgi:hypothetical protein
MTNSQNYVSPEQFAANRANAASSTGPRTPDGKARSAQNARKHSFAAAAYTVLCIEDANDVADLRADLVEFYQPANSQELFAIERIAIAQHALLRIARLETGLLTSCLNQSFTLTDADAPLVEIRPALLANTEFTLTQKRNFLLAGGFQHSAAQSNALSLCLRYAAQAERQYRRAIEDFDRIRSLSSSGAGRGAHDFCGPACVLPFDQTNPIPPEVPQNERPADPPSPQPEPVSATPEVPSAAPVPPPAPVAAFPVDNLGSASPISHDDAFPGRRNGSGPRLEPNQ